MQNLFVITIKIRFLGKVAFSNVGDPHSAGIMTFQQQMQAQHLPHHPHGPPIPLTPHPAGLQPPISVAGGSGFLSAFPAGFPGIPPHLTALKEEKGWLMSVE